MLKSTLASVCHSIGHKNTKIRKTPSSVRLQCVGKGDLHETPESVRAGVDLLYSFIKHSLSTFCVLSLLWCAGPRGSPSLRNTHKTHKVPNMIVLRTGPCEEGNSVRERLRGACR